MLAPDQKTDCHALLPTVHLGSGGLTVSRIGLGTAPLGGLYAPVPQHQAVATIRAALDCGVTLFDTAPLYGAGTSERMLGVGLSGVPRDQYVLSTKVGRVIDADGGVRIDWTRDGILRSIEASLQRLRTTFIDIVHIHGPDDAEAAASQIAYPVLAELRAQGVIRAIGAGMNQWQMLERLVGVVDLDCVLLAGRYTLLEQGALCSMLPRCQARGVSVLAAGIYNSGILATGPQAHAKYNYADAPLALIRRVEHLANVCAHHGVPLRVAATQFPLAHAAVTALVIGAVTSAEVADAVTAHTASIPRQLWHDLRDVGLIDHDAPLPGAGTAGQP